MEVGEDVLEPQSVVRPLQDPMLTSHQRCWPYRADLNSGRLLMTSNRPQTECKVLPPDSCMLMMMRMLWLHGLWPYLQDICLLTYKPLWQSRRSICWYGFSWCPLWLHSSGWRAADGPPGSFPYPVDTSWAVKAGQSILTVSNGLWCAIPGTVIHSGTWHGSWFLANRYDFRW